MRLGKRISTWRRAVFHPSKLDRELQEELEFHIARYAEDLMRSGTPREQALRRARAELGSIPARKEDCRAAWGARLWDELRADLRYALRMLAKSPAFAMVAVGSLALGIGANTAIFSMTKTILLDSIPVSHPEELRLLEWHMPKRSSYGDLPMESLYGGARFSKFGAICQSFSYPAYRALQEHDTVFQGLAAFFHAGHVEIAIDGNAEPGAIEYVSGNFFEALGVRPFAGRTLLPSDDTATGKSAVVVISGALWDSRFARSPAAIGKTIEVNRVLLTVVGVAPPGFSGAELNGNSDLYIPLTMQPLLTPERWDRRGSRLADPESWWVGIIGRIKPGISDAQAQAALGGIFQQTVKTLKNDRHFDLASMQLVVASGKRGKAWDQDQFAPTAYLLTALVALVLLLACANLANLLLARAMARQREMSVRLALGARRMRILRQTLTESMLLALLGGVAGAALGYAGRKLIPHLLAEPVPNFDGKVLCFTLGLSLLTGLLFGILPAWRATRTSMQAGLKDTGSMTPGRSHTLLGNSLVIVQICFSLVLLIGTGLFVRTLRNLLGAQLGFNPHHLLLFDLSLPETRYKDPAGRSAVFQQLEDRLSALPGVLSASLSGDALISGGSDTGNFDPDGEPPSRRQAWNNVVGERFFQTMGIPLLAGRSFGRQDTETSEKVAIINRQLARAFFPNRNPIGRTFNSSHIRIIGICGDTKIRNLRQDPPPTYYLLIRQNSDWDPMTFEIKTAADPASIAVSAARVVHSVDHELVVTNLRTQEEQIDQTLRQERLFSLLTGGFSALALVLASVGIYGTMAYSVERRAGEIGIRMALGAQVGQVLRMVLGEASRLALLGILAGLAAALAMGHLIGSMLYELRPYDPPTLLSAGALLLLVALAASWFPAHRASSVDPMQVLRHE